MLAYYYSQSSPTSQQKGHATSSVCSTSIPACSSIEGLHLILPSCAAFALVECTQTPHILLPFGSLPSSICVLDLLGGTALILRTDWGKSSKGRRTSLEGLQLQCRIQHQR